MTTTPRADSTASPIEYTVYDDKTDPAASATAAQDALSSGAVALVGGSSLLDCAVNHTTWEENGIVSIQGTGVDPYCFATPNIAPTNTGPFFDTFASLYYGSEELGFENICAVMVPDEAASKAAYEQAIARMERRDGQGALVPRHLARSRPGELCRQRLQPQERGLRCHLHERGRGCRHRPARRGVESGHLAAVPRADLLLLGPVRGIRGVRRRHLPPAEWAPYGDTSIDGVEDWAAAMDAHSVPKTSFAQGGYLAAKYFIDILESIDGDITRESFTAAAKGMTEEIPSPMAQAPYIFGDADFHQPNNTAYPVVLKAGTNEWESLGPLLEGDDLGWVYTTVPAS